MVSSTTDALDIRFCTTYLVFSSANGIMSSFCMVDGTILF